MKRWFWEINGWIGKISNLNYLVVWNDIYRAETRFPKAAKGNVGTSDN